MKRFALVLICLFVVAPPIAAEVLDVEAGPFFAIPTGPDMPPQVAGSVLLMAPKLGGHIGLVLNKPSKTTMAEIFPEHADSKNVREPVYLGGLSMTDSLFALLRSASKPSAHAVELGAGVWLVMESGAIDQILAERPNDARYFIGLVMWDPGFASQVIEAGAVIVRPVDPAKVFLPDVSKLRGELVPDEPAPLNPAVREQRL